jgi:mannobiose 2-epimerase
MTLQKLKAEVAKVLHHNIMPFWAGEMPDEVNGGFFGRMDGNNQIVPESDKGGILNARILLSFSSFYRYENNPFYLEMANRAKKYILTHFFDPEFGGTYWNLSFVVKPAVTKIQIY